MAICGGVRLMLGGFCRKSRKPALDGGSISDAWRLCDVGRLFALLGVGVWGVPACPASIFKERPLNSAPYQPALPLGGLGGVGCACGSFGGFSCPSAGFSRGGVCVCLPACFAPILSILDAPVFIKVFWALNWGGCFLPILSIFDRACLMGASFPI